jgi:hypothetical protein
MRSRTRRAPTPTAVGEPSDPVSELNLHLGLCPPDDVGSGDDDEIKARPRCWCESTEALSQQSPGPVACHGSPDLPAHGEAKTVPGTAVWQDDHHEETATEPPSFSEDLIELRARPQSPVTPEILLHDPPGPARSDGQPLSAFLPTALENHPATLRPHPDQEAVRPLPLPIVGLKRPLHAGSLLSW